MKEIKHRKTDRRTLYTLSVIKNTFLQLVKQKSYNQITITELCRLADILAPPFIFITTQLLMS